MLVTSRSDQAHDSLQVREALAPVNETTENDVGLPRMSGDDSYSAYSRRVGKHIVGTDVKPSLGRPNMPRQLRRALSKKTSESGGSTLAGRTRRRPGSRGSASSDVSSVLSSATGSSKVSIDGYRLLNDSEKRRSRPLSQNQSNDSSTEASTSRMSTPQMSSRSAPEAQRFRKQQNPRPSSYNARTATRLLKAEREFRLKRQFWPWAHKPREQQDCKVNSETASRRIGRMKKVYLNGAAAENSAQATSTTVGQPPRTSVPSEKSSDTKEVQANRMVEHFELTEEQIHAVAKYFGDDIGCLRQSVDFSRALSPVAACKTWGPLATGGCPIDTPFSNSVAGSAGYSASDDRQTLVLKTKEANSLTQNSPDISTDTVDDLLAWARNLDVLPCK